MCQHACHSQAVTSSSREPRRPSKTDVERISRGEAAKKRGTGSRAVPHRLNNAERRMYDIASQKHYVELNGSGNRRERKGSPLANTFRQWCDARARPTVCLLKQRDGCDMVIVDLSTLRAGSFQWWDRHTVVAAFADAAKDCAGMTTDNVLVGEEYLQDPEIEDIWATGATWELPVVSMSFNCKNRPQAKAVASALVQISNSLSEKDIIFTAKALPSCH